jgi:hypothetical protein
MAITHHDIEDGMSVLRILMKHRTGLSVRGVMELCDEVAALFFNGPENKTLLTNALISQTIKIRAEVM